MSELTAPSILGFWLYRFLRNSFFQAAISVIYFQSIGLSLRDIFLLEGLYYLAKSLSEIPTGFFADRIGRRLSLFLGAIISAISYLAIYLSTSFYIFLCAKIILGISMSFSSGSDSALIYDQLARRNRLHDYRRIEGIGWGLRNLAFAISAAVGSLVAVSYGQALPFLITALCNASAAFALLAMKDDPHVEAKTAKPKLSLRDVIGTNDKPFLFITIYSATIFVYVKLIYWTLQPSFQELNIAVSWFGLAYSANLGISLIASIMAHRVETLNATRTCNLGYITMLLMSFFIAAGVYLGGWLGLVIAGIGFTFHAILQGMYDPIMKEWVNHFGDKSHRATVLSAVSMVCNIGFAAASPFFGQGLEVWGVFPTILTGLFIVTFFHIVLYIWGKSNDIYRRLELTAAK